MKFSLLNCWFRSSLILIVLLCCFSCASFSQTIDRRAVVLRHTVVNTRYDSLSSLSIGNGNFAFTVDGTGLQTFPEAYANGVPLGTQSNWGWHSFADTVGYQFEETLQEYTQCERRVPYSIQWNAPARKKEAANWFRQNPHRIHLGNLGFDIKLHSGKQASLADIDSLYQTLNLYTGEVTSQFVVENEPVRVSTVCHQENDIVSARIVSSLLQKRRLGLRLVFPYPTGSFKDVGVYYGDEEKHRSWFEQVSDTAVLFFHVLDSLHYCVLLTARSALGVSTQKLHEYIITPHCIDSVFSFSVLFAPVWKNIISLPTFEEVYNNSTEHWQRFWHSGGCVDLSGSTDPRAYELERRAVLSQYLTKIQCSGDLPPQETGLTYNSWFGKFHLEMHWWHAAHFALWNRCELLEKSLTWYGKVLSEAQTLARQQGLNGARWQKMTDPFGHNTPSSVGAFLIWQQPHIIYFAELCYRAHPRKETLEKYKDLVFETATCMASFAAYDSVQQRYVLCSPIMPAQERYRVEETFNPTFELAYWRWALSIAQQWRLRLGLQPEQSWENVLRSLPSFPLEKGKYLFAESARDSYTNPRYRTDHPSVLATFGMLPRTSSLDTSIMQETFDWILENWNWQDTWGWDFPLAAMTATRLNNPDKALDALLMPIQTNTYLPNGHNFQDSRLTIYLPGNGGLLAALALMCAGYDGCERKNPGFPDNGRWHVRWEGLMPMP